MKDFQVFDGHLSHFARVRNREEAGDKIITTKVGEAVYRLHRLSFGGQSELACKYLEVGLSVTR